jgi:hypothetical protein
VELNKWKEVLERDAKPAGVIAEEQGPDVPVITAEAMKGVLEALLAEAVEIRDHVEIKGERVKFLFPNLERYSIAEQAGYGEDFRENWKKAVASETEMKKLLAAWPKFIKAVVDSPSEFILDIGGLTAGEVSEIAVGFTAFARATRKS